MKLLQLFALLLLQIPQLAHLVLLQPLQKLML
jgi:hypothetical protein